MIIYLYETLSTALSSFAYLSKQSHHLLKHGLMANCSNCRPRAASFRSGGRHHLVMVGGIIPLRRATSSRYDGRLGQESALQAEGIELPDFHLIILSVTKNAVVCTEN